MEYEGQFTRIYESPKTLIYRGRESSSRRELIIKVLKLEYVSDLTVASLENEYKLTANLQIKGICKAKTLDKYDNKPAIIFDYFAGETIKERLKYETDIEVFLNWAIQLAQTLGEIHQQNIIHKDINPNNILVNDKNEIRIIDFGLATKYTLRAEHQSNPDRLEGTVSYISPEQTGRMNRSVDYRSDLYSLGVVFFEIFTGELPFPEGDKMELIHAHIAQKPIFPLNADNVPRVMVDIILKLLSKNAENRYQSAYGLKHDLELVLQNLQGLVSLRSFRIAQKDFSGKLSIPEKLYGRENQKKHIYEIFENVGYGKTELLLISGQSGVGKTVLVHEIHKPLVARKGVFIEGKFDKFQRNVPYYAFIQAFTGFVNSILVESDEKLNYWKNLIQESLGEMGGVLVNLIPNLELIIGEQAPLPKAEGKEALNRFYYVWTNFVKAISNAIHPLAIFIDDLQWADSSSVELLKILLSDIEIQYLFCIVTYRDTELQIVDIQDFEDIKNLKVSRIKLQNLTQEDVNNLLSDSLKSDNSESENSSADLQKLATLIYSKTLGNAFFTVQFLRNLYEEEHLNFNFNNNSWQFDFKEIEKQNITDNVINLMAAKVRKLPKKTQEVLRIASCVGNRFNVSTLAIICESDKESCKKDLEQAILENLILPFGELSFKFLHDRIRQAVYSTIPEDKKSDFHIKTGRVLLSYLTEDDLQKEIFNVVKQLNFGIKSIKTNEERKQLAQLNYTAGLKAKDTSAYEPANEYMKIAASLLEDFDGTESADLNLNIKIEAAETSYLTGNLAAMNTFINLALEQATNVLDEARIRRIRIVANVGMGQQQKAVNEALSLLASLGVSFPKKPGMQHILGDLLAIKFLLWKNKPWKKKFSKMTNENMLAAMQIMSDILSASFYTNANLFPLVVFKMIRLTEKYGIASKSPVAFVTYGLLLGVLGDQKGGDRYGNHGITLLEKLNEKEHWGQAYVIYHTGVGIWHKSVVENVNGLQKSSRIALENGDLEFAVSGAGAGFTYSFMKGGQLEKLFTQVKKHKASFSKIEQKTGIALYDLLLQVIYNLLNEVKNPSALQGELYDEAKMIEDYRAEKDEISLSTIYTYKLMLAFILNDSESFLFLLNRIEKYAKASAGTLGFMTAGFYQSLMLLATLEQSDANKKKVLKKVKANQKQMKKWLKHASDNFLNNYYLVKAEMLKSEGKPVLAKDFYDKAIFEAKKNSFLNEEALAWELAANFYLQQENKVMAKLYMRNAYKVYKKWGALAKLRQLEKKHPEFSFEKLNYHTTFETTNSSDSNAVSLLDLASIVKASQSLSGTMKLENLLKKMLSIIMENAGAEYALIIKNDEGRFTIEAKGRYGTRDMYILQSEDLGKSDAMALNVVNYVIRTRKFLVVDNALDDSAYSQSSYVQKNKVKSIFCYPVVHKDRLMAILYMENNLSTHVFTADRVETIDILSSQIAISVENALLYQNMEKKIFERTEELQETNEDLNQINEELHTTIDLVKNQKREIEKQKGRIEQSHKNITHSIDYASRIQSAMLPSKQLFNESFTDSFIFFKPRDVVSGDFYWAKKIETNLIYAAADCTGHGVPGAFVSMLGMSLLNEIASKIEKIAANRILDNLRTAIKTSLKQTGNLDESKDGMDIALCSIDLKTNKLQFSGAHNSLYIIRNDELLQLKADRQPIGIYNKEIPFTNHLFQLQEGDRIYSFSDGYMDQLGEKTGRKFMVRRFKNLLVEINRLPFADQKIRLEQELNAWRGKIVQIDDIIVIGVRIRALEK